MTTARIAEIEHWLDMCGQRKPTTAWACVVSELLAAVKALEVQAPAVAKPEDWLTIQEVAKALRVTPRTVRKWIDESRSILR
jgi:predicted transcriptional regulator